MANVVGVFYVLIIGTICAVFHGILAFLWDIRKNAKQLKVCEHFPCCCYCHCRCSVPLQLYSKYSPPFSQKLPYFAISHLIFASFHSNRVHSIRKMSFIRNNCSFGFFCLEKFNNLFGLIIRFGSLCDAFMQQITKLHFSY